jgi:hypothetical protein
MCHGQESSWISWNANHLWSGLKKLLTPKCVVFETRYGWEGSGRSTHKLPRDVLLRGSRRVYRSLSNPLITNPMLAGRSPSLRIK